MIFRTLIVIFLISCFGFGQAQNYVDALRYSDFDILGSARTVGVSGSLGSLGTDFAVISTNPAGIALNRRSEFSFTPGFVSTNIKSLLNESDGVEQKERVGKPVFNSFGAIIYSEPRNLKWSTMNFGIGFNRLADFNRTTYFEGRTRGSIVDRFLELANSGDGLDPFESQVASDASAIYLLDDPNDNNYYHDFGLNEDALIFKNQTITETGSINELSLALAGNYSEKVMIGMALGLPFINYQQEKVYEEVDTEDEVPFFDNLEYRETLTTTGTGINLKLGIIGRLSQEVRIGAAIHTPTAYNLSDNFTTSMDYFYTDSGNSNNGFGESPEGNFTYRISTPWRFIGSLGILAGQYGFISGEVEYQNFTNAKIKLDNFSEDERGINDGIARELSSALRIRLGGEFAYDIFRVRAGVGLKQSPYANDDAFDYQYSAGAGIRLQSFYADIAFRFDDTKETYIPYLTSQAPQQSVSSDLRKSIAMMTLGFRF